MFNFAEKCTISSKIQANENEDYDYYDDPTGRVSCESFPLSGEMAERGKSFRKSPESLIVCV